MKMILIAAGALMTATVATAPQAIAAEPAFGFTIAGPDGYIEIGTGGRRRGHDVYDGRDFERHGRSAHRFHRGYCLDRKQIRRRLKRDGWRGLHDLHLHRNAFVVEARRRNGHNYRLRIDRCSGELLNARHIGNDHGRRHYRGRL